MKIQQRRQYSAIVIGGSAGSLSVLNKILASFTEVFPLPIIVCLHRMKNIPEGIREVVSRNYCGKVIEPDDKEAILNGNIYLAPSNYHMLVSNDFTFSLSTDILVNYSRPSIDLTIQSAAEAYKRNLIGILLTGANKDGAAGMYSVKKHHGLTIVQSPAECSAPAMPLAALEISSIDFVFTTEQIISFLKGITVEFNC